MHHCCPGDWPFSLPNDSHLFSGVVSPTMSQATLMLKQLLLVMVECIVQPTESIARLGCACIR